MTSLMREMEGSRLMVKAALCFTMRYVRRKYVANRFIVIFTPLALEALTIG